MLIDCDSCVGRGARCADCVVTVMFADGGLVWDAQERRALAVLAAAGLLPPLEALAGSVLERVPGDAARPAARPPRRAG
ncbi:MULTISPECIES: hypothetical protein [Frankia]|uniref:Uncharacterized protein n=1 Tax=Frankia alni (strain DSM 45986 / CECT 9034 / ACN14a) TaxID=326424 RepID=Q0RFK3_FRAAA|nr:MULTISPECIES: hypothetical protein [Frankia]CAJ63740.1 hypothetical protein FRAAL5100 [Frankia alni ACN14a]